jgi:ribosome-binding protein aMBF1 (putative translation factor)
MAKAKKKTPRNKIERIMGELPPEKEAEQRRKGDKILREERAKLSKWANRVRQQREAAEAELLHAAELLQQERKQQGISLSQLEQRTGINGAVLCRLENLVNANPTVGTLDKIARAMGKRLVVGLKD